MVIPPPVQTDPAAPPKKNFRHSDGQNRTLQWLAPRILQGRGATNFENGVEHYCIISDELLARRCGISDVVFEGGCVILDIFWATADAEDPHVPQCALTH